LRLPAKLTHPWPHLEELGYAGRKTTVVNELITDCAARPTTPKECDIAVQTLSADLAGPGLDAEQHGLPFAAGLSKAHGGEYTERARENTRRRKLRLQVARVKKEFMV
jgi:hypothetical protein